MLAPQWQVARLGGSDGHSFVPASGLPFMCTVCDQHLARHNQPIPSSPPASPPPLFLPLKRSPLPAQPASPTAASQPGIPTAPALASPKKKPHQLSDAFKQRQQLHFVYVYTLGCGQLLAGGDEAGGAGGSEGGMVGVKLNGSGAVVWLPRSHCTDTCWLHVRSFHNFQPKNLSPAVPTAPAMSSTASPPSPATPTRTTTSTTTIPAAVAPSTSAPVSPVAPSAAWPLPSLSVEVDLNSSLLAGLVHPIMDAYAQHGVELEEEEVRLIAGGRELTFASTATSASTLLADCPHLVPFSALLLVYDPQSSFALDPQSSTSPSLLLSSNLLTASIASDSKWCSVRASHPFTRGVHTWRLRMNQCTSGNVFVGVCTEQAKMAQYLGNDASGFGYYGCGNTYRQGSSRSYGSAYRTGDVITVVLDCDARKLSFRKNDESLGVAFEDLPSSLYPALSLYSKNDSVSIIDFGNT